MADISLLFDVAMGGGNPSGDSEQLIRSQLEAIVNGINSKPFSIKFQADEQSLQQFQKRVSEIAVSLGSGVGTSSAAFEQVTRQINIAATAIHTMNGAVNATNLEKISTALSGVAGANISAGAISDIITRLENMSVVLTDARIQFEDLGKEGERVPKLIIEGVDAAGNAIRRSLRFDNKGELERDLTDITVKLAEVEKASKNSGASTNSSGEKATDAFTKAKRAVTDYYTALTQLERSGLRNVITQNSDGTWSSSQAGYEERVTQLNRITQEYNNATAAQQTFTASQQAEFTEHETARAQQYRVAVEDVARAERQRQETLRSNVTITRSYDNTIADCQKKLKDWSAAENSRHQSSREAYDSLRNEVTAAEQARAQYNSGSISIEQYTATMDRLKSTLISTKSTLQQNGDAAKTLGEKLTGLAKKFASWFGVSQIIMYIYRSIRKMVKAVIELDTAMTELKKVTDETDATYDKFLRNAATRAKRLGASLTDIVKTSADFARLGLSLDEAETVSDAAIVYKNVGDGIEDINQASESLISTMQAFGVKAEDVMTIVDKFNVAGNNFAISSGGVGDALLNSASALAAANNTLDESIALITAANETIQNPEKVGTALKTLSMYIRAAKTEAEEAGISTEGMANSVSELRKEILSLTGNRVDIMIDDDSFKSTYQIIEELSEVWGDLGETTQANITELIGGGVRNANVINALMANMSTAAEVMEKTSGSAGSALAENEKVLSSIQGKINVFKATFQEMSQSLISSEFIKDIVSLGTGLLNILLDVGVLIEKIGGLNNVLLVTAGIIATIKADSIVSFFTKIGSKITGIIPAIMSFALKLKDLPLAMRLAKVAGKDFSAALNAVGISASAAQIAVGALVAALSIAIIAISKYNQKQEKTRQDNIDNAKAAKEEADSLRDLIDQYKRLAEAEKWDETARTQAKSLQEQIANLVGIQADNLDLVNGKLDEEIKKLDEIALKTAEQNTGALEVGKKSAEDALRHSANADFLSQINSNNLWYDLNVISTGFETSNAERDALDAVLNELSLSKYRDTDAFGDVWGFRIDTSSTDAILQSYNDMIKLQEHLVMNYKEEVSTGGDLEDFYNNLSVRVKQMATAVEEYNNVISAYNENDAIKELGNYLKHNDINSKEAFDAYIGSIKSSTEYSEAYKQVLIDIANQTFPQFADAVNTLYANIANTPDGKLDTLRNSIKSVADEYNRFTNGNVDYNKRPIISKSDMREIYPEFDGDYATTYSQYHTIGEGNALYTIDITPILEDGTVLSQEALDDYISKLITDNGVDGVLASDTSKLIINIQPGDYDEEYWGDYQEALTGIKDKHLELVEQLKTKEHNSVLEKVVSGISDAFDQLDSIYADIYDKEDFDWNSILGNEDFINTFGGLGDAYDDFIKTVANAPDDIGACQESFDNLVSSYLRSSDVLRSVTDDTRDAAVAILEQKGIANAAAIVDEQLAHNKELLRVQTTLGEDATYDSIMAMLNECEAGSLTEQALAQLAITKMLTNENSIKTLDDIEQLEGLAKSANATTESLLRLAQAKQLMAEAESYKAASDAAQAAGDGRGFQLNLLKANAAYKKAQDLLNQKLEYDEVDFSQYKAQYSGGATTEKAKKDEETWFERQLKKHQHLVAMEQETTDEYLKWLDDAYKTAYKNGEITLDEYYKYEEEVFNGMQEFRDDAKSALEELIDFRVDMLKQEVDDEKDALDKRLDNLKEFYDKQKEMLQDQRDEEKYLEDQEDKRKAVSDLQAELAMLANDDSAWAQKRKLELKEEISSAQEDLDEFEQDHALDLALDALDKAYDSQESQIQKEMDALEERLNDPNALYNQALEDIRKNSENQLYYQMLMYNRQYGDGNDATVNDLWKSASDALTGYENIFGETYNGVSLENNSATDNQTTTSESAADTQRSYPYGKASETSGNISNGSSGDGVRAIQHALNELGFGNSGTYGCDGVFGSQTKSAVESFQRAMGISADGVVGNDTREKFKAQGYAIGTESATPGIHEVDEFGAEYLFVSPSDGTKYRMFHGGEKVLSADATDFLYNFATSGGGVLMKMLSGLFGASGFGNIARPVQAIEINAGDVIVKGDASSKTVSEIRRAQRSNLEFVLKELNRLNK